MDDRSERTETDERVDEIKAHPPTRAPLTRREGDTDPETGLPPGLHDDDSSPLDARKDR